MGTYSVNYVVYLIRTIKAYLIKNKFPPLQSIPAKPHLPYFSHGRLKNPFLDIEL